MPVFSPNSSCLVRHAVLSTAALAAVGVLSAQDAAPGTAGERVPADSIRAWSESMEAVIERHRATVYPTRLERVWNGEDGIWSVPPSTAKAPVRSGTRALINHWGDPRIGIRFPGGADIRGASLAGHGGAPAPALRIHAFRGGDLVAATDWIEVDGAHAFAEFDFVAVDRIEFEARPHVDGRGWFALDDLTFRRSGADAETVLDFDDLDTRAVVTGSGYGGLVWETGSGLRDLEVDDTIHAPRSPVDEAERPVAGDPPTASASVGTPIRDWESFDGPRLGDPGRRLIPPDTCGAVGDEYYVSIVNANLSAFRRSDQARTFNVGLDPFWNAGRLVGDPRAVWDPHSGRFVLMATDFSGGRTLYFAISETNDPNGNWFKWSFQTDQGSDAGRWPDYPTLGVDARGIYTAAYMVGRGARMTIWAIDKAPLVTSTPSIGSITAFRSLPWEGAIQPCVSYGDPGGEYLVSRSSSTSLRVRRVNPPMTAPTLSETGSFPIPAHGSPPSAPALGSTTPLSTIDWRPMNAVFRNGSVWTTHGVEIGGKAGVRWYELDVASGATRQVGSITDPIWHYFYPALAVDRRGDMCIAFSGSHADAYASTFVTGRLAGDLSGTTRPPLLTKAGTGPWNRLDGAGRNRFGDYSHTSSDPVDDLGFWTIQEYIPADNVWATWITRAGFEACNYGVGLAGELGTPTIDVDRLPVIGSSFDLVVDGSTSAATNGAFVLGLDRAATPFLGGTLLVQPIIADSLAIASRGTPSTLTVPVPNDPALAGTPIRFQVLVGDAAVPQGAAFTDGLEILPRTR